MPWSRPQAGRCPRRLTSLPARHALALGLLHGPAELLPVSSSGHTTLVPWLLGWPYPQLDPELRKAFEVGLHAGTAAGLLIALAPEVREAAGDLDARRLVLLAGSFAPPAIAGLLFERQIERRFGTPGSIAAGLLAGGVAMALADARGAAHAARAPTPGAATRSRSGWRRRRRSSPASRAAG